MCNEKQNGSAEAEPFVCIQLLPAISLRFQDLEQTFAGSADAT